MNKFDRIMLIVHCAVLVTWVIITADAFINGKHWGITGVGVTIVLVWGVVVVIKYSSPVDKK